MFKNFSNRQKTRLATSYVKLIDTDELRKNPLVYALDADDTDNSNRSELAAVANKIIEVDDRDSMIQTTEPENPHGKFEKNVLRNDYRSGDITEWFKKSIITDKSEINSNTVVVRSKYGNVAIGFFNIVSLLDGKQYTGELTNDERNALKSHWAAYTKVNYPDLRVCSFAYWKKRPINEKLGTCVIKNNSQLFKEFEQVVNEILNSDVKK